MKFQWLFESIGYPSGFLYYLSTLAQCAAALASLIAVFAVFRLQSNGSLEDQAYSKAREWLIRHGRFERHDETSKEHSAIKNRLESFITDNKNSSLDNCSVARGYLDEISKIENFPKNLANLTSKPLKKWGILFFVSVVALPIFEIDVLRMRFIFIILFGYLFLLTVCALVTSRKFIQECLRK